LDETTRKTSQEEIITLRRQVADAFHELSTIKPASDLSDRKQMESVVYGFLEGCVKLLTTRENLFLKEYSYTSETYKQMENTKDANWKKLKPKTLFMGLLEDYMQNYRVFAVDNVLLLTLVIAVTELIKTGTDVDFMRNTMNVYAETMSKFKALVEDKATGKPVEEWFNLIWDRQVKRGVIR